MEGGEWVGTRGSVFVCWCVCWAAIARSLARSHALAVTFVRTFIRKICDEKGTKTIGP